MYIIWVIVITSRVRFNPILTGRLRFFVFFFPPADLPKNGPTIATSKARYDPGDKLIANCSSHPSKPHATLSFYVNNIPVSYSLPFFHPRFFYSVYFAFVAQHRFKTMFTFQSRQKNSHRDVKRIT